MVFGLFEGKIDIIIPKMNFSMGEQIQGELVLSLKKPKQARQLRIVLQAIEKRTRLVSDSKGTRTETYDEIVFAQENILGGEKLYPVGEEKHSFAIQIPQQISLVPAGNIGIPLAGGRLSIGFGNRLRWELKGALDVPGAVDVSKTIKISIT